MTEKRNELLNLNDYKKDLSEYINYGLKLIQNFETFFENSDVLIKNKLMSSIFEDKIEFDGVKYRTPKFKDGFEFIYQKINELEGLKKETGNSFSDVSRLVHPIELFSKQTLDFLNNFFLTS